MIEQPVIGEPNQSTKTCWCCHLVSIPYNKGFCDACWEALPRAVQDLYFSMHANQFRIAEDGTVENIGGIPQVYLGFLRMAIVQGLQTQLRPKPAPGQWASHHEKRKPKLNLSGLTLKDLNL